LLTPLIFLLFRPSARLAINPLHPADWSVLNYNRRKGQSYLLALKKMSNKRDRDEEDDSDEDDEDYDPDKDEDEKAAKLEDLEAEASVSRSDVRTFLVLVAYLVLFTLHWCGVQ
jgi:hypothetical protein